MDVSLLRQKLQAPLDLRDAIQNVSVWITHCAKRVLLLLIILLNFLIARSTFLAAFRAESWESDDTLRVWKALHASAQQLAGMLHETYQQEIDEIKAVGLAHGFAIVAVKLGVLKPNKEGTVRLHTGKYTLIARMTPLSRKAIEAFLHRDLDNFIRRMDLCSSITMWNQNIAAFIDVLKKVQVAQLGRSVL